MYFLRCFNPSAENGKNGKNRKSESGESKRNKVSGENNNRDFKIQRRDGDKNVA